MSNVTRFGLENSQDATDDNIKIWRYMDVFKFADLLRNQELYLPRAGLLDQHEARFLATHKGKPNMTFSDWEDVRRIDGNRFVSCWHSAESESWAMWSVFASTEAGVAIRTTIGGLASAVSGSSRNFWLGSVTYLKISGFDLNFAVSSLFIKPLFYESESEVRLVTVEPGEGEPGIRIPCDIQSLIHEIVTAPDAPDYVRDTIIQIAKTRDLDRRVRHSAAEDRKWRQRWIS